MATWPNLSLVSLGKLSDAAAFAYDEIGPLIARNVLLANVGELFGRAGVVWREEDRISQENLMREMYLVARLLICQESVFDATTVYEQLVKRGMASPQIQELYQQILEVNDRRRGYSEELFEETILEIDNLFHKLVEGIHQLVNTQSLSLSTH